MKKNLMIFAAAAAVFSMLTFSGCESADPDSGNGTEQNGENEVGETFTPDFPLEKQWVAEPEPNETEESLGCTWVRKLFDISVETDNTLTLAQMNSYLLITSRPHNPDLNKDTDFFRAENITDITITATSGTAGTITGTSEIFEEEVTISYSNLTENSVTIVYEGTSYECTAADTKMNILEL